MPELPEKCTFFRRRETLAFHRHRESSTAALAHRAGTRLRRPRASSGVIRRSGSHSPMLVVASMIRMTRAGPCCCLGPMPSICVAMVCTARSASVCCFAFRLLVVRLTHLILLCLILDYTCYTLHLVDKGRREDVDACGFSAADIFRPLRLTVFPRRRSKPARSR